MRRGGASETVVHECYDLPYSLQSTALCRDCVAPTVLQYKFSGAAEAHRRPSPAPWTRAHRGGRAVVDRSQYALFHRPRFVPSLGRDYFSVAGIGMWHHTCLRVHDVPHAARMRVHEVDRKDGWTPCIGPILGSILVLAATEESINKGILLLIFYSLGLALPFILSGYLMQKFLIFSKNFKKNISLVSKIGGIILLITGILILTNQLQALGYYLLNIFPFLQNFG